MQFLHELMQSPEFYQENSDVQKRIVATHEFVNTLTTWINEMLKLSTGTLNTLLTLGAKVQKFLK